MTKRKRFSVSQDITQGLTDVINAVDNHAGNFRYEVIALARIETDPENPRELALTCSDITNGINRDDKNYIQKKQELMSLDSLAKTIDSSGVINPVVVYKHGDKYRLIAGERRYLASMVAGKTDIHARILSAKPSLFDLRLLQWIENNERSDLSLNERIENLQSIIDAHKLQNIDVKMTGELLGKITGMSKTQSKTYLAVIKGPDDLKREIQSGNINNLEKAMLIAGIIDDLARATMISACVNDASIKEMKELLAANKRSEGNSDKKHKKNRVVKYVNLGKVETVKPIQRLVELVMTNSKYASKANDLKMIKWDDLQEVSAAFKKIIKILSEGEG